MMRMLARLATRDSRQLRKTERGAAAVEFAILAPLFFMITFGMISAGITFNRVQDMTGAVRQGSRFGATLPVGTTVADRDTWVTSVLASVTQTANGQLDSSDSTICVAVVTGNGTTIFTSGASYIGSSSGGVVTTGSCPAAVPNFPFADGNAGSAARVEVVARRPGQIMAVLFTVNPMIDVRSVGRYEESTSS